MRYGYGRVSSRGQRLYGCSLKEQKEQLLAQGISEENIYLDDYTGTKMSRPQFDELCSRLQPGDELVVSKLDRLARTSLEGPKLVREFVDKGIRVNILNMGVADNTPMGKVLITVMFAFAEFERDMILERTANGKAYKREHDPEWTEGRKKKPTETFVDVHNRQLAGELSVDDACGLLNISRRTYYRRAKECST